MYCNVPGMGKFTKILVPAGADAAEMYVRTGDVKRALVSGGLSIVGDVAGGHIDKLSGPLSREVAGSAVSAAIGGTVSYMNGGGFGEGMLNGMVNRIGGRIGSKAGTAMVERYGPRPDIPEGAEPTRRPEDETTAEAEARVKRALDQPKQEKEIGQPENIQKLLRTTHSETVTDPDGKARSTRYVDPQEALDQLTDTRSSRTAKNLPDAERQAIINTRKDKLYAPADQATIERIRDKAGVQKMLQPGDTIEMDTFSTPGKPPSLGADRDARLVIRRPNPAAERGYELIEIPRKHWENEAYEEFYKHTHKLATQDGREMDAEALKVFNERKKELQYLKKPDFSDEYLEKTRTRLRAKCEADNERIAKYNEDIEAINQKRRAEGRPEIAPLKTRDVGAQVEAGIERLKGQGLTGEQIEHRAWAESKNQLFTDGKHVEASRDNSDQAFSVSRTEDGRIQVTRRQIRSPVLDARDGKAPLQDADGYSRMWSEKSRFYGYGNQNTPEAVAQSQKGIAEYMKLRDGARAGGNEPPPLKPEVAEAMDKILRTPVGQHGDQEAMDGLNADLRAIRDQNGKPCYTDVNDAMNKIAGQNEYLRFSRPQVDPDAAVTPRVPPAEAPSPPTVTPLREGEVLNLSRREVERSLSREPPTAAAAAEPSAKGFAALAEPTARAAAAHPPEPTPYPAAERPPPSAGPQPQRPSAPPDAQAPTPTPSPYGPRPGAAPREPPGSVTAGVTEARTFSAFGEGAGIAREGATGGAAGGLREGGLAHAGGAGEMPAAQQLTAGELHRAALGREQAGTAAPLGEGAGGLHEGGLAHAGGAGEMPATEAFTAEELHRATLRRETEGLEQERERLLKELAALRQRLRGEAPGGDEDG